jgi:hypothetical protein
LFQKQKLLTSELASEKQLVRMLWNIKSKLKCFSVMLTNADSNTSRCWLTNYPSISMNHANSSKMSWVGI